MKIKILTLLAMWSICSCSDPRSRKRQNREQYPPEKLFKETQLEAAEKIFDADNAGLKYFLTEHPEMIDQLSSINGYTLLMYAAIIEDLDAMEILLLNGADPDIVIPRRYMTPVSHAVGTNNYKMLKLLINYKATLNPTVGNSPLCSAMLLGGEGTEQKMIDFLLDHGADINHVSYLGNNIMEAAARTDLKTAAYFLEKGGNPRIKRTDLSPMAEYIETEYQRRKSVENSRNAIYFDRLLKIKKQLIAQYGIKFPVKKDPKAAADLYVKLYEGLSEKDKRTVNFNNNYGKNRYQKDKKIVEGQ